MITALTYLCACAITVLTCLCALVIRRPCFASKMLRCKHASRLSTAGWYSVLTHHWLLLRAHPRYSVLTHHPLVLRAHPPLGLRVHPPQALRAHLPKANQKQKRSAAVAMGQAGVATYESDFESDHSMDKMVAKTADKMADKRGRLVSTSPVRSGLATLGNLSDLSASAKLSQSHSSIPVCSLTPIS